MGDLLDVGSGLGHVVDVVAGENELVLDVGRLDDVDAHRQLDGADDLLTQEVADGNGL